MTEQDDAQLSAPLVNALENAWQAIRSRHPEVPPVILIVGQGSTGKRNGGLKYGHYWSGKWHTDTDKNARPEIFIGGEGLKRGAVPTLGTLIHEACHALARVREVQDTSRQGRYHNLKFKALADELGIKVTKDVKLGWSPTTVPDATVAAYQTTVDELTAVLRMHRVVEPALASTAKSAANVAMCGCDRKIRISAKALAVAPILCGECEQPFEMHES